MTRNHQPTFLSRLLLAVLLLQLAACAGFQSLLDDARSPQRPLAYFAWLESADQASLEGEHSRLAAAADSHPRISLVQRALLLSVPPGTGNDDHDTARELLAVALQEPADARPMSSLQEEYTAFARIWMTLLEQRQEYRSAQANQLTDKDRIRELSVKVDRLEKQIEALTSIEQRLIEREQVQGQPR